MSLLNPPLQSAPASGGGGGAPGFLPFVVSPTTTTDATPTVATTIPLTIGKVYHVDVVVVAISSSDRASYHLNVTAYNAGAGAVIQGSETSLHTQESDPTWDVSFIDSGGTLQLVVTGSLSTIIWTPSITYLPS